MLNWEKCHFMVQEEIVLGQKISVRVIEVDKAKIDVIDKLHPSVNTLITIEEVLLILLQFTIEEPLLSLKMVKYVMVPLSLVLSHLFC